MVFEDEKIPAKVMT